MYCYLVAAYTELDFWRDTKPRVLNFIPALLHAAKHHEVHTKSLVQRTQAAPNRPPKHTANPADFKSIIFVDSTSVIVEPIHIEQRFPTRSNHPWRCETSIERMREASALMTGNWYIYYSPAAFLYSFKMDCRQKREVRSYLCVTILIIRANTNCNIFFLFTSLW